MKHIAIMLLLLGCSAAQRDAKVAGSALVDCAKQDVTAAVPELGVALIAEVARILSHSDESTWRSDLDALGKRAGSDAVVCAAKAAAAVLALQSPPVGIEGSPPRSSAADRGASYWADRRVRP